jgi:hypothetical protein
MFVILNIVPLILLKELSHFSGLLNKLSETIKNAVNSFTLASYRPRNIKIEIYSPLRISRII